MGDMPGASESLIPRSAGYREKYTAVDWNMFLSDSFKYRDTSVVFFGRR